MEKIRRNETLIRCNIFVMPLLNFQMRSLCCIAILALTAAGCVTKSQADAQARKAYLAGQQAAYQSMQGAMTDITILGAVQKHQLPWQQGLTLAQALARADYNGAHDPVMIILKRNSVETQVDPKQLLNGQDVSLQPGDVISVVGE